MDAFRAVQLFHNHPLCSAAQFGKTRAEKVSAFHRSFPEYAETPLRELRALSRELGVGGIYVKDESFRFGLNAFKVLGSSYAIGEYIAKTLNEDLSELPYERLVSAEIRRRLGDITFVTATDGNHGRGAAWTANRLGQKCVVYMPRGTAQERLDNILALGADASIPDLNYDDCVRLASKNAREYGWVMVQDTAFPGYEEIPEAIMAGYSTMAREAAAQLGEVRPTHLFLQAGVGSMAGSVAAYFADLFGSDRPIITVVEPNAADCHYRTAAANDGTMHCISGDMPTIMAGLACGEPCTLSWQILHDYADFFVSMPDYAAACGMRLLANPIGGDPLVVSGESGASGFGCVAEILRNPDLSDLRERMQLNADSRILCFSTEGATDRANYRRILWDGAYPHP